MLPHLSPDINESHWTQRGDQLPKCKRIHRLGDTETALELLALVFGGPERDRTADLLVANEALSQLSYRPVLPATMQRTGKVSAAQDMPANDR